ncbi:MAG TPA: toll/interleukin-1 receptor domain-containing protein [Thermoanaerobaculia bacterium]|nr:toll/interleukin-1 receptor domain-containing protein [Thermoanaerobaculia bacterium]
MASDSTQRTIIRIQGEIERFQHQQTQVAQDEARKYDRINQLTRDMSNTKSLSIIRSKQREIQSCQADIGRLQSKRADLTKRVSAKTAELHKYQQQLYREQSREQRDALTKIQRDNDRARAEQRDLLQSVARPVRSRLTTEQFVEPTDGPQFDAFISHATEDKEDLVRPLAEKLIGSGVRVWYDEFQLKVGDSLRRNIDRGLASSRFGIVVLSPSFFEKNWPQYELDGLVAREMEGRKVILPLWHKISKNEVIARSPSLADKVALNTATYSIDELAAELAAAIRIL